MLVEPVEDLRLDFTGFFSLEDTPYQMS